MEEEFKRNIFFYKQYFPDFYKALGPEVRRKFDWTLKLITTLDRIPIKFFKHLEGTSGLYEIRVEVGSNIFRVFSFFDEGQLIILVNGFQKKTQKTPKAEIEKAEALKKQYFEDIKASQKNTKKGK